MVPRDHFFSNVNFSSLYYFMYVSCRVQILNFQEYLLNEIPLYVISNLYKNYFCVLSSSRGLEQIRKINNNKNY